MNKKIKVPVLVIEDKDAPGQYFVISGQMRLAACNKMGVTEIKVAMETAKELRKEAVLRLVAHWEHQQAEKAKIPYYKDKEIELSYFKTPEQFETCLELVEKYHNKIYTNKLSKNYVTASHLINLRVVKSIAKAAGLDKPYVFRDPDGDEIWINHEVNDSYGNAIEEIVSTYHFCLWLAYKEQLDQ
jgi:hypothetical protein